MRVARYIDKTNVTEIFEDAAAEEPTISHRSSSISKLHLGRLLATKYFFREPELKKNRKLWDSVKALSDQYRSLLAQNVSIDTLRKELKDAEMKRVDMAKNLEDQISKVGFTYTTLENPTFRPEMIINRTDATDPKLTDAVILNCKLVRYIFCTDTILDRDDPAMAEITIQSLELGNSTAANEGHSTPKKQSKTKSDMSQHSPSRMDAER